MTNLTAATTVRPSERNLHTNNCLISRLMLTLLTNKYVRSDAPWCHNTTALQVSKLLFNVSRTLMYQSEKWISSTVLNHFLIDVFPIIITNFYRMWQQYPLLSILISVFIKLAFSSVLTPYWLGTRLPTKIKPFRWLGPQSEFLACCYLPSIQFKSAFHLPQNNWSSTLHLHFSINWLHANNNLISYDVELMTKTIDNGSDSDKVNMPAT